MLLLLITNITLGFLSRFTVISADVDARIPISWIPETYSLISSRSIFSSPVLYNTVEYPFADKLNARLHPSSPSVITPTSYLFNVIHLRIIFHTLMPRFVIFNISFYFLCGCFNKLRIAQRKIFYRFIRYKLFVYHLDFIFYNSLWRICL